MEALVETRQLSGELDDENPTASHGRPASVNRPFRATSTKSECKTPAADAARKRTVPLRRACPSGEPALIEPAPQQLDLIHAEP